MKHFLELEKDYIIKTGFQPNKVLDENNKYVIDEHNRIVLDWVDKENSLANGFEYVDIIYLIEEECDSEGNLTGLCRKIPFKKDDILKLVDKIKDIESTPAIGLTF